MLSISDGLNQWFQGQVLDIIRFRYQLNKFFFEIIESSLHDKLTSMSKNLDLLVFFLMGLLNGVTDLPLFMQDLYNRKFP